MEVELTAKDLVLDTDSSAVEIISNPSNDQTKEVWRIHVNFLCLLWLCPSIHYLIFFGFVFR